MTDKTSPAQPDEYNAEISRSTEDKSQQIFDIVCKHFPCTADANCECWTAEIVSIFEIATVAEAQERATTSRIKEIESLDSALKKLRSANSAIQNVKIQGSFALRSLAAKLLVGAEANQLAVNQEYKGRDPWIWLSADEVVPVLSEHLNMLITEINNAKKTIQDSPSRGQGNTSNTVVNAVGSKCFDVFCGLLGREPGYTTDPVKDEKTYEIEGFLGEVFSALDIKTKGTLTTISKRIDKEKKSEKQRSMPPILF